MSHIFISYSRKDIDFAQEIVTALAANDLDTWIDWKSIPKGEDWEQEIYRGIEEADAFLFLISPDSVISEMCNKEIAHAVKNSKRILPIVVRDTERSLVPSEISKRNWIFCRGGQDDFDKAVEQIRTTINTDYEWVRFHTELQVKALKWELKKDRSRLLRGKELRETEKRLPQFNGHVDPDPTELQKLFLSKSRQNEKNLTIFGVIVGVVLIGALVGPFLSRERAIPGQWISIPAGNFTMGMDKEEAEFSYSICSDGAEDKTQCWLPEDLIAWSGRQLNAELAEYEILDNEVTNAQYQQCVDAGTCQKPEDWSYERKNINDPATNLNWFQAKAYCEWLGGRLPTEGEWEKAARGPLDNYFPWGKEWDPTMANLEHHEKGTVQSVVQFAATDISDYGVKNMAGNVQEWTISDYTYHALSQEFENLIAVVPFDVLEYPVIVRGGSWVNPRSLGMVSNREVDSVTARWDEIGFRCVCPNEGQCKSPWNTRWIWFGN